MTLTYESVFPARRRGFQVEEAPYWGITAEYKMAATDGTIHDLITKTRSSYEEAARQKGCSLHSFYVRSSWTQREGWPGKDYHHIKIYAVITGSPIPWLVVLAILAVIALALIAVVIYLVGEEVVKPLFQPPGPGGLPMIFWAGVGIAIPIGVYALSKVIRR